MTGERTGVRTTIGQGRARRFRLGDFVNVYPHSELVGSRVTPLGTTWAVPYAAINLSEFNESTDDSAKLVRLDVSGAAGRIGFIWILMLEQSSACAHRGGQF